MSSAPPVGDLEQICRETDPVERNRRITRAYHALSAAVAARTGGVANWCTFATWASRQAGRTIRGEDLARAIEAELGGAEEVGDALARIGEILRRLGHAADRNLLVATVRDVVSPVRAAERAGEAVARGNLRVFEEIALPFARFEAALDAGADAVAAVSAGLRPGPPPEGQDLLRGAFARYGRAVGALDRRACAEHVLLANLRIGLHEQTRLQPDIAGALDAPVADPREVKARLLARVLRGGTGPVAGRLLHRDTGPLDDIVERLVAAVRRRLRRILTEHFMTLELPDGRVRLGLDVVGVCPPSLVRPQDGELCELLARVDPTPESTRGSGAHDWSELGQRMHFITELFRTRQEDVALLGFPPDA